MQTEKVVQCPYCWENIDVLIDPSVDEQEYIEDCQVCCRPIQFKVTVDYEGDVLVETFLEDETY